MELGPSIEQKNDFPCEINGQCQAPIGTTTIGLIYVNPEGPMNEPNPIQSALEIREVFQRMTMNDSETVVLIGGGHTFGKMHGACPYGPGKPPKDAPDNPWPGLCGSSSSSSSSSGSGKDTYTSGFEGQWTSHPTTWSTEYFYNLKHFQWITEKSPGNRTQWRRILSTNINNNKGTTKGNSNPKNNFKLQSHSTSVATTSSSTTTSTKTTTTATTSSTATNTVGKTHKNHDSTISNTQTNTSDVIRMLTSDIALMNDPEHQYQKWVAHYYNNSQLFTSDFAHAWYKLMTRDMGPISRCIGPFVPPAQDFQNPLPPPLITITSRSDGSGSSNSGGTSSIVYDPTSTLWLDIRNNIKNILYINQQLTSIAGDTYNTTHYYYGSMFIQLAYACAITYRRTDYSGGCNGGRIRFAPEKEWDVNIGLIEVLQILEPIQWKYSDTLTWSDLIVFAAQVTIFIHLYTYLYECSFRFFLVVGFIRRYHSQ